MDSKFKLQKIEEAKRELVSKHAKYTFKFSKAVVGDVGEEK